MKVCPYCQEMIHDGATKCRYCCSSLAAGAAQDDAEKPGPNQVVYVLDKDLVRFAKFAVPLLAIFVAVGAAFYGMDVKNAEKDVGESLNKARDLEHSIEDENKKLDTQIKTLDTQIEGAKTLQATIQQMATEIAHDKDTAAQMLVETQNKIDLFLKESKEKLDNFVAQSTNTAAQTTTLGANASVLDIARFYDFPADLDGANQTIGIIELGGGYTEADLTAYFGQLKRPVPSVTAVSVDGAKNAPGGGAGEDAQVTHDIEIAGAVAPAANLVVFFAPNSSSGYADAVRAAIDYTPTLSALSIAWGSPEDNWVAASRKQMDEALKAAAAKGVTVLVAAGDNGASDGAGDGKRHVDFPASSPWVLGVGGTTLPSDDPAATEVVWNDRDFATGGGVSSYFPLPEWQVNAKVPARADGAKGRGVPDVAASADPAHGYRMYLAGKWELSGGTSLSTPLWAGLIALIDQGLGRKVGYINPLLYSDIGPAGVLRSITKGNNTVDHVTGYEAGPGWNPCTGWGSPDGRKLLAFLKQHG